MGGLPSCMTQQTVVSPLPSLSDSTRAQKVNWSDPEELKSVRRSRYDSQKFRTGRFDAKKFKAPKDSYRGNLEFKTKAYQKGELRNQRSLVEGEKARWQDQKARTFTSRYQGRQARTTSYREAEKSFATGSYRESEKGYRDAAKAYSTRTLGPTQISRSAVETAHLRPGNNTLNEEDVRRVLNKTGN